MAGITVRDNTRTSPRWAFDRLDPNTHLLPGGKASVAAFNDQLSVLVKLSAAALADAVTISVDALSARIPAGTLLHFGEAKEFARTTADAAKGATSIAVEALPAALEDNDEARYSPYPLRKIIPSGTLIGRTYAERDAGTAYGPAVDTDDEFFIMAFDGEAEDPETEFDVVPVRAGTVIRENYLPDWTAISADADLLAKLRATYQCIKGVD